MSRDVRYRFQGRTPPTPGARQPLAQLAANEGDGVAVIRLYDFIDSWGGDWGVSAKEFAAVLDGLADDTTTIRLHINSPGGEVFEGIAIMNLLRAHRAQVVTVVDGLAASAASFIAAAGDEVVMSPNTELMIHDAWGFALGNAQDMRSTADLLDHLSDNIANVYAMKAGGTTAEWRALMLAETWFSAEEAVTAGLADRVAESGTAAQNRFDLSAFNYAGRAAAPAPTKPAPAAPAPPAPAVALEDDVLMFRHRMNKRRASV